MPIDILPENLCPACLASILINGWCKNCGYEEYEGAIFDSFEDEICGKPD